MAAGITVAQDKLPELAAYLRAALGSSYRAASAAPVLLVDGALNLKAATLELAEQLESAGPFGQGNPAPRFCLPSVRLIMMKEFAGGQSALCVASNGWEPDQRRRLPGREIRAWCGLESGRDLACHVAGRIERDEWGGRNRIEFQIEDVAPAGKR